MTIEHIRKTDSPLSRISEAISPDDRARVTNAMIQHITHDLGPILQLTDTASLLNPLGKSLLRSVQALTADNMQFDEAIKTYTTKDPTEDWVTTTGMKIASKMLFNSLDQRDVKQLYGFDQSIDTAYTGAGLTLNVPAIPAFQRKEGCTRVWKIGETQRIAYHYPIGNPNQITFSVEQRPKLRVSLERMFHKA